VKLEPWRQQLVVENQRFVYWVARRSVPSWMSMSDDAISEGMLGLVIAASKFDPTRKNNFRTFAAFWIRAKIMDFYIRSYSPARFGGRQIERLLFFRRAELAQDEEGVAAKLGASIEDVREIAAHLRARPMAIDPTDEVMIPSAEATPEETAIRKDEDRTVRRWMARLTVRERRIIRARVLADDKMTLEQLGEEMGVSRERIRQLETKALRKLQKRVGRP
jgi:RNA polymerase sigma-32 factor